MSGFSWFADSLGDLTCQVTCRFAGRLAELPGDLWKCQVTYGVTGNRRR
jgi:hypothetical protein